MKKLLAIACFGLFAMGAQAQVFQLGLRGGLNLQGMSLSGFKADPGAAVSKVESEGFNTGFHLGFYSRIKILTFYIQPELLYRNFSSEYAFTRTDGTTGTIDVTAHQMEIPVLVGMKFAWFRANLGPVYRQPFGDFDELGDGFNGGMWGYQAGVGVDFWKLLVDVKYEGSFSSFGNSITVGGESYPLDSRPGGVVISLGYKLF